MTTSILFRISGTRDDSAASSFVLCKSKYSIIIGLSRRQKEDQEISGLLREVNIKSGMPIVDDAIKRVTYNIKNAKPMGVSVLKLIHGYGSTGKGGGIRTEVRKYLERLESRREIKGFIIGEKFSIFDEDTRKAFLVCDELRRDSDLERHNNGITIVIL